MRRPDLLSVSLIVWFLQTVGPALRAEGVAPEGSERIEGGIAKEHGDSERPPPTDPILISQVRKILAGADGEGTSLETLCDHVRRLGPDAALGVVAVLINETDARRGTHLVRLLGRLGDRRCIGPLVAGLDGAPPEVSNRIELALVAILRKDAEPRTYEVVRDLLSQVDGERRITLVECVGQARSPYALQALSGWLGRDRALDLAIVRAIGRLPGHWDDGTVSASLRGLIEDPRPELRREVAIALGRFRDGQSAEGLVTLLSDPDEEVRESAHWALVNLSGLHFALDPDRWRRWLEEETAWWEVEGPVWLERLESDQVGTVLEAIHVLSRRTLFHASASDLLIPFTLHPNPEVRRTACLALGRIGVGASVPSLVEALQDDDAAVRSAAAGALRAITGEDRGTEYEDWAGLLHPSR